MFDTILVPTDGSDVATAAADAAITLADRFDATLHVIHVLEPFELPPDVVDEDAGALAHSGEAAIADIVETATAAGAETTSTVIDTSGQIHENIIAYAGKHDVDCIVMGTYGRTGLDRFVLGSVAEQTLRESPIPVLTVHEETKIGAFDSVLVPTDGSDSSRVAADDAIEFALSTGAALHIVHVVDVGVVPDGVNVGQVMAALEDAGERAIDDVISTAQNAGVSTIEASLMNGRPHRAITDYAADNEVACIVMGTHGRTGIDRYLLGSVTERVVRLSEVPVLTVKGADSE
ncbi:universal stress protein [Haloarcula sp. JP-L23]|uniref:universal stress protein n=1 Tax=Haloarcula sp. JP-L23 TaxID=2716717 RepID=UPI00140ED184|nr:universal stress protein [Haloarcula sp. JP-L23]